MADVDARSGHAAAPSSEDGPTVVVHVRCGPHGEWFIQEGRGDPLSWHDNETEAEGAAIAHVRRSGGGQVFVRDRYHRIHAAEPHSGDR